MSEQNPYEAPAADMSSPEGASELAGRGIRLGAVIIDGLIVGGITFAIMMATGYMDRAMAGTQGVGELVFMAVLGLVIFIAVQGYFLAQSGQTVGKKILGIQIVDNDTEELVPVVKLIGMRYVILGVVGNIPLVGFIASIVNALFIFRDDRRCVHDLLAGTKVIVARV